MILIIIALIAIFGVGGLFSLVGWFSKNHHIFNIIAWLIEIPIFVILIIVAVIILYFIYWLITDLIQRTIKKIKNKKAQTIIKRYKHE